MAEGRPLRADARRNRERVLEVAREAFAAEGMSVPLDEIARRAGVGPGTLYRHFPTKEALLGAVMHDRMRRLADEAAGLCGSADPGAAFFAFIDRIAIEAGPKRDLFEALASAGSGAGQEVASAVDDVRDGLACLLDRAQRAGAVRAGIGSAELTALLSGMLFALRPRPGADLWLVVEVFKDALRPR
jgi:AcrR family transcriptional regulator